MFASIGVILKRASKQLFHPLYILIVCILVNGVYSSYSYGISSYISMGKYILPLLFICAIEYRSLQPDFKFYIYILLIHSAFAFIYLVGQGDFFSQFFVRYTAGEGSRGFSYISTEPSYAATYIFSLLIIEYIFFSEYKFSHLRALLILFLVALTKSALGFGLIFIGISMIWGRKSLILIPFSILIILFGFGENSRFYDMIEIFSQISADDPVASIVVLEPSGTTRLLVNIMAYKEGIKSIFGYGVGSFETNFIKTMDENALDLFSIHELLSQSISVGSLIKPNSFLSSLTFDLGILSGFFVYYFHKLQCIFLNDSKSKLYFWLLFCVFYVFQGQITSPTAPYILAMLLFKQKKSNLHYETI